MLYKQTMRLPEGLSATLAAGGLVVASSARAARALRNLYAEEQRDRGLAAWRSPAIVDWEGWLESLWQQRLRSGDETRLLLTSLQEHELWVRLIRPEIEARTLISIDGVAELARQAYALLCDYDSPDTLREDWPDSDAKNFCEWARAFEEECRKWGWLSRSRLPLILSQLPPTQLTLDGPAPAATPAIPTRLALVGFDRITPAQQRLLADLEKRGCTIEHPDAQPPAPVEALVVASDAGDELSLCAWWARRTLELAATTNKKIRIAVLVPRLASQRSEIERVFRQVLAAGSVAVGPPETPLPFEFSLGVPLARTPMARAAILLLRWMSEPLGRDELAWLALSGFFWREESDWLPVAMFDAELRRTGVLPPEYPLKAYLRQRGWNDSPVLGDLRNRLHRARREWREATEKAHGFADWAEAAQRILSAAGWPGALRMSSEEFQLRTRWERLLDNIAMLGFDGRRVVYADFLRVLRRQAEQTIFSPQSHDAPVQILGPFEAAGLEFDAVWFLGASDDNWPAPGRPHPFLPTALQRERGMPHAGRNADWELARLVTERIQRSTSRLLVSYPMQEKDGQLRPSPVFLPQPPIVPSARMRESLAAPPAGEEAGAGNLALVLEEEEPSGAPWPRQREAGGYAVLKMQATCPFQAFAHFRLQARPLDRADWGLEPKDRGTLLHKALEGLWSELKDRDSLIEARGSKRLREIVERHVDQAMHKYRSPRTAQPVEAKHDRDEWSDAYLEAERRRVIQLLENWLAYEAERMPFTVEHSEQKLQVSVGDLKLSLRADRVDRVHDGRLLIDYKTGPAWASAWEGDRPDEPQLPLYATFGNVPELRGVLLAQIRAERFKFAGCLEEADRALFRRLPGCSTQPYSTDLQRRWRRALLALAEEFLNGEARVDPKRYPDSCKFCALPGLCRVGESELEWADLETKDAGTDGELQGSGDEEQID